MYVSYPALYLFILHKWIERTNLGEYVPTPQERFDDAVSHAAISGAVGLIERGKSYVSSQVKKRLEAEMLVRPTRLHSMENVHTPDLRGFLGFPKPTELTGLLLVQSERTLARQSCSLKEYLEEEMLVRPTRLHCMENVHTPDLRGFLGFPKPTELTGLLLVQSERTLARQSCSLKERLEEEMLVRPTRLHCMENVHTPDLRGFLGFPKPTELTGLTNWFIACAV